MRILMMSIGALALAAAVYAQPPGPPRNGRGLGARFLGAEAGMPGRVVKNAPYSADVVSETTQTLADGNHIKQSSTSHVYRDSEGRTRREPSLQNLNALAPNSNLPQVVFINDPVTGANYALDVTNRTATKSTWGRGGMRGVPGAPGGPAPMAAGQGMRGPMRRNAQNVKTEALGKQMIEGVQAEGTRETMTIPAGQIGNENPIQIVTETWYSPELQTVVLRKRTDPRNGESVMRLTNISRTEPASTLFQVPVDFKMTELPRRGRQ